MCLILIAWRVQPDYPLVVVANRDEFFDRPTAPASFWAGGNILAGRDLREGGTWMGVTHQAHFAAVTNYRDPGRDRLGSLSRGRLVADFLSSGEGPSRWLSGRAAGATDYNGFNLIAADRMELAWASNVTGETQSLPPGIYGLSNHLLDSPWPKVIAARSALAQALSALPDQQPLFDLLGDDTIHPDDELPRTGISLEWERLLSSAFVKAPGYGTRSSTVLVASSDGHVIFEEQTWLEGGKPGDRIRFRFRQGAAASS
jgi:uncharacterized protein with NRDE domain